MAAVAVIGLIVWGGTHVAGAQVPTERPGRIAQNPYAVALSATTMKPVVVMKNIPAGSYLVWAKTVIRPQASVAACELKTFQGTTTLYTSDAGESGNARSTTLTLIDQANFNQTGEIRMFCKSTSWPDGSAVRAEYGKITAVPVPYVATGPGAP